MKVNKIVAGLAAAFISSASMATVVVSEGFDNIATLAGAGWVQVNASTSPVNPFFQGNPGIFTAVAGAPDSYVGADFLSGVGVISNWLMTPEFTFASTLDVNFLARVAGAGYLDTINVWLSSSGSSTNVADFTTLLGSYSSSTDEGWVAQNFSALTASGLLGRVAFQYFVADTSFDGNYIGIDSVNVSVPEPTSLPLAGLALGGLALSRRRRA